MSDREILETCLNSASKNTSEADIFPHGPKSLLTSVIIIITTFIIVIIQQSTFYLKKTINRDYLHVIQEVYVISNCHCKKCISRRKETKYYNCDSLVALR